MRKLISFALFAALTALVSCTQQGSFTLEIDRSELTFTKAGGFRELVILSNQQWEIMIEDTEWLSASKLTGEGNATILFIADPYEWANERSNRITVKSATIVREIAVTQTGADPMLEVDKQSLSYNYAGGTEALRITSNTDWEIVIEGGDGWLTADISEGAGDAEVVLTAVSHFGEEDRSATILVKCDEIEREVGVNQTFPVTLGVWMLSEGSATQPTADLAWYDAVNDEVKPKYYSEVNNETLGQVANYMGLYGSKLYVAVSGASDASSSSVKVINPRSGELIKTIDMKGGHGEGDVARQLAFHNGKVYVTSYFSGGKGAPGDAYSYYGGVVKIDTVSLTIEAYTRVGDKPEGIAVHGDKLLVLNNESGNGETMSIVDIATFREERTVTVPENPTYIKTTPNGDIYLSTLEIFTGPNKGRTSALHRLDPATYAATTFEGARAGRLAVTDKYIFTGEFSWSTYADTANRIDRQSGTVTPINLNHNYFMIYSFDSNPVTGEIYVGGCGDDVIILNGEGEKLKSFRVGTAWVNQFVPVIE